MKHTLRKWSTFTLRWGIAVAGIWWVLANTPFHDELMYVNPAGQLVRARVVGEPPEDALQFNVVGRKTPVDRDEIWTQPDNRSARLIASGKKAKVLAVRLGAHPAAEKAVPLELLIADPSTKAPVRITPQQVAGGYRIRVPYPPLDKGIIRRVEQARLGFLLAALMVLPFAYLVTSRRWHLLLEAMDIHLTQARSFVLNMVGCFYNSFMPGSTGGDLVKAWYAAQHTTHKVRAVLSVIVDRVVGLLALVILGGIMAAMQWHISECRHVAMACAAMILATLIGLVVFYHPRWRKASGLEWLIKRMPMQRQVHHAVEAMELYGRRPAAPLWGLVMTFPVHITSVVSAILAGAAFELKMPTAYYFTVVPVIVLVSAIPIAPQGAGVMEVFAILLTRNQGVSVSQAIALAMAIRFGQMFWNLVAGIFVLRGGYHAPSQKEQEELESDEEEEGHSGPTSKARISTSTPNADDPIRLTQDAQPA